MKGRGKRKSITAPARINRMRPAFLVAAAALTCAGLAGGARSVRAQTPAPRPVEALPDVARLTPAEVAFVHPLTRAFDDAPKLAERTNPPDLVTRQPLTFTVDLSSVPASTSAGFACQAVRLVIP